MSELRDGRNPVSNAVLLLRTRQCEICRSELADDEKERFMERTDERYGQYTPRTSRVASASC